MIDAYPLQWPTGWPRTEPAKRTRAKFGVKGWTGVAHAEGSWRVHRELSIDQGTTRILAELARLGVSRKTIVLSTNLRLRQDGMPLSKQSNPDDVGAAVYWTDKAGAPRCIAIDIYDRIADNLGAIAATIEAMRAIERHGGARILERAFTGFTALPAPLVTRAWWQVLGLDSGEMRGDILEERYRLLRSKHHPDKGGSNEAFVAVQRAYEQGRAAMGIT